MPVQAQPVELQNPPPIQDADAPWAPDLFPRQFDIINDRHRILLVCGPMKTGKSIGICHKIVRHLWEVNGAYVGIFVTSYKVATDGGSWTDLTKHVLQEWIGSGIEGEDGPLEFTTFIRGEDEGSPKLDSKSRTPFFRIRNMHGGESECRLFSVDNENEIEAKIKGLRLSAVWIVELSTFPSKKILSLTLNRLRAFGVAYEDQFLIADTNPAPEGKEHWAYKLFYQDRTDPAYPDKEFQAQIGLLEIFLNDNTKLDPRERRDLENTYRDDHDEYLRFVDGQWPDGPSRRREVFADILTPAHFPDGPLDIPRLTETLITGWDMGAINSAFVVLCRHVEQGVSFWMVLAETILIDTEISTAEFTTRCLDQMISINEFYKAHWPRFPGFLWRHWSDNSSTAFYKPQIGDVDAAIVYEASNGQIELQGVDKPANSVEEDTKMLRTLIREGRLFVGANCPQVRRMLKEIKRGARGQVDAGDKLKHAFDALRYPIRSEWIDDMNNHRTDEPSRSIVLMPLH